MVIPEHLFAVVQAISDDDTYDIIYIPLKEEASSEETNGQPLFVPGGVEVCNIGSGRHAHGQAIDLPYQLPFSIDLTSEDQIVLLNRKQGLNEIRFRSRSSRFATIVI